MDTTAGSGGSFVTPQYFVADYAPWRQAGRVYADQSHKLPLPDFGMTVFLPAVSGPAGVGTQATQNTGITETDPTAGYLSSNLTTLAGHVVVSVQLLDRAGPNFQFDQMIFDQLTRKYNQQIDSYLLTAALANASAVTYTSGAPVFSGAIPANSFLSKVAAAKSAMATTDGTILAPNRIFMQPSALGLFLGQRRGQSEQVDHHAVICRSRQRVRSWQRSAGGRGRHRVQAVGPAGLRRRQHPHSGDRLTKLSSPTRPRPSFRGLARQSCPAPNETRRL